MATVPVPDTWATGGKITASKLNTLRDSLRWLGLTTGGGTPAPYCNVFRTGALSPATATFTIVSFDAEVDDTDSMHDLVTNPSRVIAQTAGEYLMTYGVVFAANATGRRVAQLQKNSGGTAGVNTFSVINVPTSPVGSFGVTGTATQRFAAADYVEMFIEQESGGALAIVNGASFTFLTMEWRRP
jgi:hypothetical protein